MPWRELDALRRHEVDEGVVGRRQRLVHRADDCLVLMRARDRQHAGVRVADRRRLGAEKHAVMQLRRLGGGWETLRLAAGFERGITEEYLALLAESYARFFYHYAAAPVLIAARRPNIQYSVDSAGDVVTEAAGEGTDRVRLATGDDVRWLGDRFAGRPDPAVLRVAGCVFDFLLRFVLGFAIGSLDSVRSRDGCPGGALGAPHRSAPPSPSSPGVSATGR